MIFVVRTINLTCGIREAGYFIVGVEGKTLAQAQAEADDGVIHPIEPDYKKDGTKDDDEEDDAEYTNRKQSSLKIIAEANVGVADDDDGNDDNAIGVDDDEDNDENSNNDNVEKQEKDKTFYQKQEQALKRATLLAKLWKYI